MVRVRARVRVYICVCICVQCYALETGIVSWGLMSSWTVPVVVHSIMYDRAPLEYCTLPGTHVSNCSLPREGSGSLMVWLCCQVGIYLVCVCVYVCVCVLAHGHWMDAC